MARSFRPAVKALSGAILVLVGSALGGCAGDANPVRDLAMAAGVTGGEPKPAPDFVVRTRTSSPDYLPVGISAPPRRVKPKDPIEVKRAEGEMQALGRRNAARGAAARRDAAQE